jgi:tetratricopeptide (TPR) repeat protein
MIMRLSTLVFAALVGVVPAPALHAQALTGAAKWADSARREIDAATLSGDLTRLVAARTLLDRALTAFPNDPLLQHYQGYAMYRMLNVAPATSKDDVAGYVGAARDFLQRSNSKRPMAESYILLSAIYGREIAADPSLGQTLGMEIQQVTGEARALGPNNPRVFLLQGQGAMFTPPEWGGGPAAAEKLLARAVELFATDHPAAPEPAWGKAEAYAWLGQVYASTGRKTEAMAAYRKALDAEPTYKWVSNVLIPALQK